MHTIEDKSTCEGTPNRDSQKPLLHTFVHIKQLFNMHKRKKQCYQSLMLNLENGSHISVGWHGGTIGI
jgi:hypothetical protein